MGVTDPCFSSQNIAYQISLISAQFREHLVQAIERHGMMNSYTLREQLERFIVEPMNEIYFVGPVVIVIDALDESGVENGRKEILQAIAKASPKLPSFVKVLLTSRNERDIRAALASASLLVDINKVEGIVDDVGDIHPVDQNGRCRQNFMTTLT